MTKKSIIYVNFSPYDNTGRTLDYLVNNFNFVAHFSFDHLRLKNNRRAALSFYSNGKLLGEKNLHWLRTHPALLFPSLPFVAVAMFVETLWYCFLIKQQLGTIDTYLTVNAFPAFTGIILRELGLVKKTIFWVWDYYPPRYPNFKLRIIRKAYLYFDNFALKFSTKVIFLNEYLRKSRNLKSQYRIIPIGTSPAKNSELVKKQNIIGHMGLLKESQGLDLLLDNLDEFFDRFPDTAIEIVGSGPEHDKYVKVSAKYPDKVKFYGFIDKHDEIDRLVSRWKIGLATYIPTEWSEHYWGDPSKIKAYLANATPVITTAVPEFSKEVEKAKAGIVISYNKKDLFDAIEKVLTSNKLYSVNALTLAKKFEYNKIYSELLT